MRRNTLLHYYEYGMSASVTYSVRDGRLYNYCMLDLAVVLLYDYLFRKVFGFGHKFNIHLCSENAFGIATEYDACELGFIDITEIKTVRGRRNY